PRGVRDILRRVGRWCCLGLFVALACGGGSNPRDAGVGLDSSVDGGIDGALEDAGADAGSVFDASFTRPDADVTHPSDDTLRLHHVQMLGTHNSYHRRPRADIPDWRY